MSALFKVVEVPQPDPVVAQQYAEAEYGRDAAVEIMGADFLRDNNDAANLIYRLARRPTITRRVPSRDLKTLISIMDNYLAVVLPAFEALEGEFAYGAGNQLIQTADGQTFNDRRKAALHVLELDFIALWKATGVMEDFTPIRLTRVGKVAICNGNAFANEYAQDPMLSQSYFTMNIMSPFKAHGLSCDLAPEGAERRFRDALAAILGVRAE